jgi:hypothetical protein
MRITKAGVVMDIPESEVGRYLRLGYKPHVQVRKPAPAKAAPKTAKADKEPKPAKVVPE